MGLCDTAREGRLTFVRARAHELEELFFLVVLRSHGESSRSRVLGVDREDRTAGQKRGLCGSFQRVQRRTRMTGAGADARRVTVTA